MPTDELPLDEVASHPSEVNQPVRVHAAVARITAQIHRLPTLVRRLASSLALPLSAGASALRQQN
jgi:hypothetical protein